jgi:four helix bundle protein
MTTWLRPKGKAGLNSTSISTSTSNFLGDYGSFRSGEDGGVPAGAAAFTCGECLDQGANTRGFGDLVSQLRDSTASMPANILEAGGEWRPGKRLHYLMIAKGSTWESWAHVDTMVDFEIVKPEDILEVRDLQNQITALLITTIRNLEAQGAQEEKPLDPTQI